MSAQAMDHKKSNRPPTGRIKADGSANRRAGQGKKNRSKAPAGPTVLDIYRQEAVVGTEFRRICDNIGWVPTPGGEIHGPKSVLITSALTSEGKSTVAAFLAITAAVYLNQQTLLLDCDLRRPAVHRMFRKPFRDGVTDCLQQQASVEHCLRATDLENLKIMTAGTTVDDPTELLRAKRWAEFLEELAFYFDRIVIDCAPLVPVDDAITLGRSVDGVVMVLKAGDTQREVAGRATKIIQDTKLNLLGIVLNNLKESLPYYYNHKYYGYRYKQTGR